MKRKIYLSWEPAGPERNFGEYKSNQEQIRAHIEGAHAMGFQAIQLTGFYGCLPYTTERQKKFLRKFYNIEDMELDVKALRNLLDSYNMKRTLHIGRLLFVNDIIDENNEPECEDFKRHIIEGINFVKELGGDVISFHPPYMEPPQFFNCPRNYRTVLVRYYSSFNKEAKEKVKDKYAGILRDCLDETKGSGVRLAVESFPPPLSVFENAGEYAKFVREIDPRVGILMEMGHWFNECFDLKEDILTLGDRLFDVHAKDAFRHIDGPATEDWTQQLVREVSFPIGEGDANWAEAVDTLKEIGYEGLINLEIPYPITGVIGSRYIMERLIEGDEVMRNYFYERANKKCVKEG